ncbi:MAG: hypothetical protein CSB48_07205 [Proteobacteria bacterium]|nr:MAG: hypothetical protein CSB48_07205 [Pseudomonadota bacterium]PIE40165.1 MAG: hypothetical protein CSA51_02020 [Gammaproteobacteria bacterium]
MTDTTKTDTTKTDTAITDVVKAPKWAKSDDISKMKEKSMQLVEQVKEKAGPALMRAMDALGASSQDKMTKANTLMAGSVGSLLQSLDGKSPSGEKLLELRSAMDELNPHSLHNSWWFSWMPKSIKRKAVSSFVHKYEPMQKHVNQILNGLREGKDDLLQTSIELEHQYDQIAEAQREIQGEIHVGELFIKKIEEMQKARDPGAQPDVQEEQKLASVLNKAARRVRDLRTMEQAAVQFFISIDQTIQSNELLGEQIDSALTVGPMVMTNALRIQAALAKQATVQQAVASFQEGLGDLMQQNAEAVNKAADEIGDLYNNPVIALEKLEQGFDQLVQAVNKANETMATSTIKAREASAKLESMTRELSPVAQGLKDARDGESPVIDGEVVKE